MLATGALRAKNKNMKENQINAELRAAEDYLSSHPVLEYSPGDLNRLNRALNDYLQSFSPEEQLLYRDYYSEELD